MAICVPVQKSQNLKGKTRANGKRLVKMTKIVSILSIFDGQKKSHQNKVAELYRRFCLRAHSNWSLSRTETL